MAFFNHAARQMAVKIVYYGPGLCGKTANLDTIHRRTVEQARGEMVSLNTDTDRTLFFDLLPMDMGTLWGFSTKLQLYTVPGQVFYNATRKLVLKGADGLVFVADSQAAMLEANRESLWNLEANLAELGVDLRDLPLVFQWNKRDLVASLPLETLERELNPRGLPSFCSIACEGAGVFETLTGITRQTLARLKARHFASAGVPARGPAPGPAVRPSRPALLGRVSPPRPLVSLPRPRAAAPPVTPRVLPPRVALVPPRSFRTPVQRQPVAPASEDAAVWIPEERPTLEP